MIELIPAIDLIEGRCVRLSKGDYNACTVYQGDPIDIAKSYADLGFTRLHVVDLDGAKSQHIVNHRILHGITSSTGLVVDFGGGIKSEQDLNIALDNGAAMVTIGSLAVTDPERMTDWIQTYGPQRFILGADTRDGYISISGWCTQSNEALMPFLEKYWDQGLRHVLCTDIHRDGMLSGPATSLYQDIMQANPKCHLIASGGVSGMKDILDLADAGIPAVVFGKAIYEGKIDLQALALWNERQIVEP